MADGDEESFFTRWERVIKDTVICPHWPQCGCGTQSGPHTCEWRAERRSERERYPR